MVADKRAEAKFHSLMGVIERLNAKKKQKLEKTENTHTNGSENQEKEVAEEADDLITFKEFVDALEFLRGPKNASTDLDSKDLRNFDLRILPRTLSFREVLGSQKYETAYQVTDSHLDDFAMLRYELNSIFNKHLFEEEKPSQMFMGTNPLSKVQTQTGVHMLRDLDEGTKRDKLEMYRPPGVLKTHNS